MEEGQDTLDGLGIGDPSRVDLDDPVAAQRRQAAGAGDGPSQVMDDDELGGREEMAEAQDRQGGELDGPGLAGEPEPARLDLPVPTGRQNRRSLSHDGQRFGGRRGALHG